MCEDFLVQFKFSTQMKVLRKLKSIKFEIETTPKIFFINRGDRNFRTCVQTAGMQRSNTKK